MSLQNTSNSEQHYIVGGCHQNCRRDGRTCNEVRLYREITGEALLLSRKGSNTPTDLSHGSARVYLETGETDLFVSVRADLVTPCNLRPSEGVVSLHVDLLQERNEEMECTLSELLLPHLVDKKLLCVVAQKYVWRLNIDILVKSSSGGSLLDACGRGIQTALASARIPFVRKVSSLQEEPILLEIDGDYNSAIPIPGLNQVLNVWTISILEPPASKSPIFILDATQEEESCAVAQAHVVIDCSNTQRVKVCSLHKVGGGSLPFGVLNSLTDFVVHSTEVHTGKRKPNVSYT